MKKRILLIIISLMAISLVNCALLKQVQQRIAVKNCRFNFTGARAHTFSLTGFTVDLNIRATNPNNIDVITDRIDLMLYINDRQTVSARFKGTTIPTNKSKALSTVIQIPYTTAGMAIIDILKSKKPVSYRLEGTVHLDTKLGTFSFPVTLYRNQ